MIVFQPEPIGKHDVVFTDIDNNEYLVHSIILQNKSTVFRDMKFDNDEKLKLEVNQDVAMSFFHSIYSLNGCKIKKVNSLALWKLLVEYNVDTRGIQGGICCILKEHIVIDEDFLVDVTNLAVQFRDDVVMKLAIDCIFQKYHANDSFPSSLLGRLPNFSLINIIDQLKNPKALKRKTMATKAAREFIKYAKI